MRTNPFELSTDVTYAPHQCTWKMYVTYVNPETLKEETVEFGYPLTISFNIHKNIDAQTNIAQFKIYNLSKGTRSHLYQVRFNTGVKKFVKFMAGYGTETECFVGYIQEGYSERQGTETVTTIECWDIGMGSKYMAVTFDAGTTFKDAFKNIASTVLDWEIGEIGGLEGSFKTPTTLAGTPFEILNKISNYHTFIDDGKVKTLQNNECLDVPVYQVNSNSGLLQTPQFRGGQLIATSIFRPELLIGQLYEITSEIQSEFDGTFKVCGFTHSGTISGAVGGQRTTQINLLVGALLPNSNFVVTNNTETGFKKVKNEEIKPVTQKYGASVEEVYRYIRENNGKMPNKKITKNISWIEMIGNENTDSERYNELTKTILYNCENIAKRLQSILDANYSGKTITVVSGWRSVRNNRKNKGVINSRHLLGSAIDFVITGVSSQYAWQKIIKPQWRWFSYVNDYNSIHIQVG